MKAISQTLISYLICQLKEGYNQDMEIQGSDQIRSDQIKFAGSYLCYFSLAEAEARASSLPGIPQCGEFAVAYVISAGFLTNLAKKLQNNKSHF